MMIAGSPKRILPLEVVIAHSNWKIVADSGEGRCLSSSTPMVVEGSGGPRLGGVGRGWLRLGPWLVISWIQQSQAPRALAKMRKEIDSPGLLRAELVLVQT